MKKIIHIINGLGSGGAENMLYKLLKYSNRDKYYHEVISLMDMGVYGEKIEGLGIKVHSINVSKKNLFSSIKKIKKILNEFDIVDTWLYHSDLVGFIIGKVFMRKKLIWNVRHSNLERDANKSTTLIIVKLNSILSKHTDLITYNSNKAIESHKSVGYTGKEIKLIPNGFELDRYCYNFEDRKSVRKKLDLADDEKMIITVGRWDIQKDYYTLLKSLKELRKYNVEFNMVMVGVNLDYKNTELVSLIDEYKLNGYVTLLGRQSNIPSLLSAADIYVSSSLGESFSNAIGEAMACELPCVVTNVGDSKLMVGDTGKVVEPKDYIGISRALCDLINNNSSRNTEARNRIIEKYEIKNICRIFEKNYDSI